MEPESEPYLAVAMAPLVNAANAKAGISIYGTHSLGQHQAITDFRSQTKMSRILRSEKAGRHSSSTVRLWTSGSQPLSKMSSFRNTCHTLFNLVSLIRSLSHSESLRS